MRKRTVTDDDYILTETHVVLQCIAMNKENSSRQCKDGKTGKKETATRIVNHKWAPALLDRMELHLAFRRRMHFWYGRVQFFAHYFDATRTQKMSLFISAI